MNKNLKLASALVLVCALFSLGAGAVWAGSPAPSAAGAAVVDNASHSLAANSTAWYRFDYQVLDDASRPMRQITLANATNTGLGFEVWTAEQLANLARLPELRREMAELKRRLAELERRS